MTSINQDIFLSINNYAGQNRTIDFLMVSVAQYLPYLFIVLLLYLWFSDRKKEALYGVYTTTLGIAINLLIGIFYFHPRPFMDNLGHTLLSHKAENSFPSDHTTFVLSIALMLLTFKSTRILGIIASVLALWCGIARVYCGVHYPFDIFASIVVSIFAVIIIRIFKKRLQKSNDIIIALWSKIFQKYS